MLGFNKRSGSNLCHVAARQIAERCAAATLAQLNEAADAMSAAELRGYIRAQARPFICAGVQNFVATNRLSKNKREELAAQALEQTIHLVTRALAAAPIISMPAPHISRRAAA